jgi:voltage-gated potassium channel
MAPDSFRFRLHEIIFEADTPAGKLFDVVLIACILASVVVVTLDSVQSIQVRYGVWLQLLEWFFTALFSFEYLLRLSCVREPLRYVRSFYGIVDLLAILPSYVSLFIPGSQYLLSVRILRLLRVFRVLKLVSYLSEAQALGSALRASGRKISVFLLAVFSLVVILGSLMYLIEGPENGFNDIPTSAYWAIVTLTTVGYGDIAPVTPFGKLLASLVMILGYGIIAVPTGIVTVELSHAHRKSHISTQACPRCTAEGHDVNAVHCKFCGEKL